MNSINHSFRNNNLESTNCLQMACSGNPILGDPETVSQVGINGAREPERTGERAPLDATLNKPVPPCQRLTGMLVSDHVRFFPIGGQNLSHCFRDLLIRGSLPVNLQLKENFNSSRRVFQ